MRTHQDGSLRHPEEPYPTIGFAEIFIVLECGIIAVSLLVFVLLYSRTGAGSAGNRNPVLPVFMTTIAVSTG